jgi:hypothetical protein
LQMLTGISTCFLFFQIFTELPAARYHSHAY